MSDRYIAGGKLYFSQLNADGATYAAEREIGEVQDVSLQTNTDFAEAMNKDGALPVKSDKVAKSFSATLSFSTIRLNKENLAMALNATLTTEIFAIAATLPNGATAAAETTLDVIQGGENTLLKGKFRFVAEIAAGTNQPVLEIPIAVVSSNDAVAFMSDDFASLKFDGEVLKHDTDGYFKEYLIPVV